MKTDRSQNRKMFAALFCVFTFSFLLLLASCRQSAITPQGEVVKVVRVVSGQTLEAIDTEKQPPLIEQVRLIGIEAPDLRQRPWGTAAKERLEEMIGEKPVLLELDREPKDQSDRQLAYVWQDGVLLNEKLVAEGYALFYSRSLNNKYDERLEQAQEFARIMGLGIWNPEKPMRLTPRDFREQYR
ncbi:thermonuclease family protein [Argonema antarcticum]|uniref:thermonuclease family protein n=1 Tax=Argonema antarcticum TaxID=2942763 RepID=UPI002011EA01|nr:thermonuclease family protein [Argonema antarcticum]MCL1475201.1 thermonuclease family protein [Argonema antarcticum A004/B2]